jgi:hypothetical protein
MPVGNGVVGAMKWAHFVVARSVMVVRLIQPCSPPV